MFTCKNEINKVIITNNAHKMYKYHNEIKPLHNEYSKMEDNDFIELRKNINHLIDKKINKNIIIGTLLETEDPQRQNQIMNSNNYDLLKPFVESANKFNYKVMILHNNLSEEFIKKYSTDLLEFTKVNINNEYNVYVNRFKVMYNYLKNNPVEKVIISDVTDVVFLKENLFDYIQDGFIYTGIENKLLNINWVEINSEKIRSSEKKYNDWWNLNKNNFKLLNCGLIGGDYKFIEAELEKFINILIKYAKNTNETSDMFVWNYVLYNSDKKIIFGSPFHTEFKKFDLNNKECYLAHK